MFFRIPVLAVAIGAILTLPEALTFDASTAALGAEQPAELQAQGMAALKTYWTAIVAGTPAALAPVLAPEWQIQRSDGTGYGRETYLTTELPKVAAIPEFTSVSVTGNEGLLVVRYFVTVESTRNGKKVQRHAPRLTIFRKEGDAWLAVAHANFAALDK